MSGKHYLFLGDSITDAGHLWEDDPRMLGHGFIRKISEHPSFSNAHLVNRGQDGFTAAALLRLVKRMSDLSSFDAITVLIGVNDLSVAFYSDPGWFSSSFVPSIKALFACLRAAAPQKIFVMEPFLFTPPDSHQRMMPLLFWQQQILKELCTQPDLTFIPLQDALAQADKGCDSDAVTVDGIHPSEKGCMILANAWISHCLQTFPHAFGV